MNTLRETPIENYRMIKLLLLRLVLRVKKTSQYLSLMCQIVLITLNVLVDGHDSENGNVEMVQENYVEEFDEPCDDTEIDDGPVVKSSEMHHRKNFKCSQCGKTFLTLTYLSQHKNAVHAKTDKYFYMREEKMKRK